ncbi:MAG: hypothetical protein N6V49_00670 [Serratia symbiotica]|nr:hypothetical protein [Serratia symbiotica]
MLAAQWVQPGASTQAQRRDIAASMKINGKRLRRCPDFVIHYSLNQTLLRCGNRCGNLLWSNSTFGGTLLQTGL